MIAMTDKKNNSQAKEYAQKSTFASCGAYYDRIF